VKNLLQITDENFEEVMLRSGKLAVLDFGAAWCAPCKKIEAILDELAPVWQDKVVMGTLDISSSPETPRRYGVLNIPQVLIFKNGQLAETIVGVLPKAKFEEKLKSYLS
jgi:thioredoxin 1